MPRNVAAYVLGFHASVDLGLGTTNWCLAVLTCFAPLFLASFRATRGSYEARIEADSA